VDDDWESSSRVWALEPADVPVVIERCGVGREDILAFAYKFCVRKVMFDERVGGAETEMGDGWGYLRREKRSRWLRQI
jgi:hypothetical protein